MSSAIDRGDEKRLRVVDAIPVWLAVAIPLPGRVGAARCDHPGPSQAIKRREPQAWRSVGGNVSMRRTEECRVSLSMAVGSFLRAVLMEARDGTDDQPKYRRP